MTTTLVSVFLWIGIIVYLFIGLATMTIVRKAKLYLKINMNKSLRWLNESIETPRWLVISLGVFCIIGGLL
jgi:hypothetical protein